MVDSILVLDSPEVSTEQELKKPCSKCVDKTPKPLSGFGVHAKGKYGRQAACLECCRIRNARYRKDHPEQVKEGNKDWYQRYKERRHQDPEFDEAEQKRLNQYHRATWLLRKCRQYGITIAQYEAMYEAQGGLCAICHRPETIENQWGVIALAIDHNHITDKVRGLLCKECNTKLAVLEDLEYVIAAQRYLEQYRDIQTS